MSASCCAPDQRYASAVVVSQAEGRVELAVTRQSACTACAEKKRCGGHQETPGAHRVWLATDIPLKTGETVSVAMSEQTVWHAALLMYGLPLAGFVLGLLLGAGLGDGPALLGALLGLAAGFGLAGRLSRRIAKPLQLFQQPPTPISIPIQKSGGMTHD